MLSRENSLSDLPEILTVNGDGTSFCDNQQLINADLSKPVLDSKDPVSKFSIRDYVFSTRGKDLENHWPFSKKSLQLCLTHSVENVLPPYHSHGSVGNQFIVGNVSGKVQDSSLALSELRKNWGSEGNSVLVAKKCEPQAESLVKNTEFGFTATADKEKKDIPNPVKKCRSSLKLSSIPEPNTKEVLPGNSSLVLEAMASKVCPVCKTFSSSSNTTLNAHIDQCLSVEPTNKWKSCSKVSKQKMRPRKTRLIVDIYATAVQCTLEDLEKRNGITRAAFFEAVGGSDGILAHANVENNNYDVLPEEIINKQHSINRVDENEEALYFDSNGTRVRILSKLALPQEKSSLKDDSISQRLSSKRNWDKEPASLSGKKKRPFTHRHKLLRHPPGGRSSHGLKARNVGEEVSHQEEYENDQVKCDGAGSRTHLKSNEHEWKIKKTRSALLGSCSTTKAKDSTLPTVSAESSETSGECAAELQPHLRKRRKTCISESTDKLMIRKRFSRSFVRSEGEASAQTRLPSCEKQSKEGTMFSGGESWLKMLKKDTKKSGLCYSVSSEEDPIQGHDSLLEKTSQLDIVSPRSVGSLDFTVCKRRFDISNTRKQQEEASKCSDTSQKHETRGVEKGQFQHLTACEPASKTLLAKEDSMMFHESASLLGIPIDNHLVTHFEKEMSGFEQQAKYSFDVEPIAIPGPPGSFLPSPGRVCSEEHQGNSSLSVRSSEHEHELANTESADSPVSGTSFVSNSFAAKADKVSGVSYDESPPDVAIGYPIAVGSIGHETESRPWLSSSRFKNSQPYICERIGPLNGLESLPRTMIASSIPFPSQRDCSQTKECCYDFSMISQNLLTGPTTAPSFYVIGNGALSCSSDARFSTYGDCVSLGLSPNSVIRLMGKNLMVANKVESQSNMNHDHPFVVHSSSENIPSTSNALDHLSSITSMAGSTQNCIFPQHFNSHPYHYSGFSTDFSSLPEFQPSSAAFPVNKTLSSAPCLVPVESAGVLYETRGSLGRFSEGSGYHYQHRNRNSDYSHSPCKNAQKTQD